MTEGAPDWAGSYDVDQRVRAAAFSFLREQTQVHGETLSWTLLLQGFQFEGKRVPLLSQQGIFKPAVLPEIPLTIRTAPEVEGRPRPYEDSFSEEGILEYRYRGSDTRHRENAGVRAALERRIPLIYLYGVVPGEYLPIWPVYVVADDPKTLCFRIQLDAANLWTPSPAGEVGEGADARKYVVQLVNRRIHQQSFSAKVLRAYKNRCSVCRLGHRELLDAAHILPDGHPRGLPVVPNGLALCKLHHAGFDQNILGIRPNLHIEIRGDVLRESDGPMLRHGLQGFQGEKIIVPPEKRLRPNPEFLEERYELFRKAG